MLLAEGALLAIHSTIQPKGIYPLPVMTSTKKQKEVYRNLARNKTSAGETANGKINH